MLIDAHACAAHVAPPSTSLVTAILSIDVLNAATPIVIAVVAFGWLMYLVERRDNNAQFHAQHSGVYFASVSIATFGFGDVAPVVRALVWTPLRCVALPSCVALRYLALRCRLALTPCAIRFASRRRARVGCSPFSGV